MRIFLGRNNLMSWFGLPELLTDLLADGIRIHREIACTGFIFFPHLQRVSLGRITIQMPREELNLKRGNNGHRGCHISGGFISAPYPSE